MNIIIRTVSITLGLIVAALAIVFFSPDYNLYVVRSGSMNPAINMGDIVIVGPVRTVGGIKPGDIVTYEFGKNLITHRVISIDGDTLITKGDANEDHDPWSVLLSNVRGIYLFKIPYIGYLSNFVSTRLGWFLAIILPAMALVGFIIKDILKATFSDDKKVQRKLEVAQLKKKIAIIARQP